MIPEEELILLEYEDKIIELQNYLETGDITKDEYDELIEDFRDVDRIRDSISDEKKKIYAEMIVTHLSKLLTAI